MPADRILRGPRRAALAIVAVIITAASLTSFAESYRALYLWAGHHGVPGLWAAAWPLQVDVFIAVGELALFVALADSWSVRSRAAAWTVTLAGLAVSVAGNIGHIAGHDLASRATAAVPPLAAAALLAVGLGLLKRTATQHQADQAAATVTVPVPGRVQPHAVAHTAADRPGLGTATRTTAQLPAGSAAPDPAPYPAATIPAPAGAATGGREADQLADQLRPVAADLAAATATADRVRIAVTATGTGRPAILAAALTAAGYPTNTEAARSALRRDRRDRDQAASVTRLPDRATIPAS
jgi:hypothetical protein